MIALNCQVGPALALSCGQCSLRTFPHAPEPEQLIRTHAEPRRKGLQTTSISSIVTDITRHAGHGDSIGRPRPADGRGGRPGRPREQHVPGREAKHRLAEYHVEDDRAVGRVGLAAWLIVTVGAVVSGGSITR